MSGYDVALLRLVRNVSESAGVGTIELAEPEHAPSKLGRGRCIITGWGVKDLGNFMSTLNFLYKIIIF